MTPRFHTCLLACVLFVSGCYVGSDGKMHAREPVAERYPFTSFGLAPPSMGYRVPYSDASRFQFVSADWRIDNYDLDDVTERPARPGRARPVQLVVQNRRNNGEIWIDSFVLAPAVEQTELRVLAENFAASVARGGYFEASVVGDAIAYEDRRYAARILDQSAVRVGGRPGHALMMDISNLQQHEVDESALSARALVVFVRPAAMHAERRGFAERDEPLLLVAGYVNSPGDFAGNLPDFMRFLQSIEFTGDATTPSAEAPVTDPLGAGAPSPDAITR